MLMFGYDVKSNIQHVNVFYSLSTLYAKSKKAPTFNQGGGFLLNNK